MHCPSMTRKNFRHEVTRLGRGRIGLQRRNRMQQGMIRGARIPFLPRQGDSRLGQTLPQRQLDALTNRGLIRNRTFFRHLLLGLACHKQRQAQGHRQRTRRNNQSLKMHAHGTKPPPRRCVCGFVGTAKKINISRYSQAACGVAFETPRCLAATDDSPQCRGQAPGDPIDRASRSPSHHRRTRPCR